MQLLDETRDFDGLDTYVPALSSIVWQPAEQTLLQRFNSSFRTIPADSADLIRKAYQIRYQVYCVEHPFEDRMMHPDGLEKDEFDRHAAQSLIVDRFSDEAVGTVRLVLPRPEAPQASFAIQHLTDHPALGDVALFPPHATAEISRFSLSKSARRSKSADGDEEMEIGRPRSGCLMRLGLMQTIVRMSVQHGITNWCAVMEPKLLRLLAAMSIHFQPIGAPVDYHGLRQPCYSNVVTLLKRVRRERYAYWELLTDGGTLWEPLLDNQLQQGCE